MLKKTLAALAIGSAVLSANVMAADYTVDTWATATSPVLSRTSTASSALTLPSLKTAKSNST
jgi:hypothetical protein